MSAEGLGRTIIWVAIVLVVIIILAIVVLKLLAYLSIAPYAFASTNDNEIAPQADKEDPDNMVGKETVDIGNDTELHITCTENIEGLVEDCG